MMKSRTFILIAVIVALPALSSPPASAQDSPLVAAAKRSKPLGSRTAVVITNETLARNGASAHVTTTKSQAPLSTARIATPAGARGVPEKKSEKRAGDASTAGLDKKQAKVPSPDDAEAPLEDEGVRGDLVSCRTCLPILETVPKNMPMSKAVPSTSPPHVVTPQPAPTVPARSLETVPPRPPESRKNL